MGKKKTANKKATAKKATKKTIGKTVVHIVTPAEKAAKRAEQPAKRPQAAEKATKKAVKKAAKKPAAKRLGGLGAAVEVLKRNGNEPMRIKDIYEAAVAAGLWNPAGKTPVNTLAAAIGTEIRKKGDASRFVKAGRGLYKLRD